MSAKADTPSAHAVRDALLTLASLVVVLAGARYASNLVVPFLLAMFIAILLSSPIAMLGRRGLPRWLSVALVSLLALGVLGTVFVLLGASVKAFINALPAYQEQLTLLVDAWVQQLVDLGASIDRDDIASAFDPAGALGFLGSFLSGLGDTLSHFFLILFLVIFILGDAESFQRKMSGGDAAGSGRYYAGLQDLAAAMNNYITTKTLIGALTGVLITIGMALLDVRFALLWGFIAFLLNFVPNIGSVIAAVPPVLLSLLDQDPLTTGLMIALYLLVNTLVGNILEPRIMGRRMGLSALAVFLSLLFWGWMFGPVGMLLSVPLTMLIKFLAEQQPGSAWLGTLLSGDPQDASEAPAPDTVQDQL